jgi:hypothetical protein
MRLFTIAVLQIACVAATVTTAAAQMAVCEPYVGHPQFEVSFARSLADEEVTNALAAQTLDEDVRVKNGIGFIVSSGIPVGWARALRIEAARTDLAIVRQPAYGVSDSGVLRERLGSARLSYATASVVRSHPIANRVCFETALGVGAYRLRYADHGKTRGGVNGMVGVDAQVWDHTSLLFGLHLHAIFQDGMAPLASHLAFVLRPSVGVRFRF